MHSRAARDENRPLLVTVPKHPERCVGHHTVVLFEVFGRTRDAAPSEVIRCGRHAEGSGVQQLRVQRLLRTAAAEQREVDALRSDVDVADEN